jgi:hypothetical protein
MQESTCLGTLVILKREMCVEHYFEDMAALIRRSTLSIYRATSFASIVVLYNDQRFYMNDNDRKRDLHAIKWLAGAVSAFPYKTHPLLRRVSRLLSRISGRLLQSINIGDPLASLQ